LLIGESAYACGWWGDGEVDSSDDAIEVDARGRPLEQSLSIDSMKLPGQMGYGIAVPEPGRVTPYLLATFGQPVTRIGEFKIFGFRSVIDLGTPAVARLHRSETEAAGMRYFHVAVQGDMPNRQQADSFNRIVVDANNGPLLVYAPKAELLAVMWAFYRLYLGSPVEFALQEGRALGLTEKQEVNLRTQMLRSKSKGN